MLLFLCLCLPLVAQDVVHRTSEKLRGHLKEVWKTSEDADDEIAFLKKYLKRKRPLSMGEAAVYLDLDNVCKEVLCGDKRGCFFEDKRIAEADQKMIKRFIAGTFDEKMDCARHAPGNFAVECQDQVFKDPSGLSLKLLIATWSAYHNCPYALLCKAITLQYMPAITLVLAVRPFIVDKEAYTLAQKGGDSKILEIIEKAYQDHEDHRGNFFLLKGTNTIFKGMPINIVKQETDIVGTVDTEIDHVSMFVDINNQ